MLLCSLPSVLYVGRWTDFRSSVALCAFAFYTPDGGQTSEAQWLYVHSLSNVPLFTFLNQFAESEETQSRPVPISIKLHHSVWFYTVTFINHSTLTHYRKTVANMLSDWIAELSPQSVLRQIIKEHDFISRHSLRFVSTIHCSDTLWGLFSHLNGLPEFIPRGKAAGTWSW
jgi:hypothetical protein